jgi:2'-5' RNA ligase
MKEIQYACLMAGFNLPNWDEFIQKFVNPADVLKYEDTPHVTVLYGLDPDIKLEDVKSLLLPLKDIFVTSSEINEFNQNGFDVVKFDVSSPLLAQMNDVMKTLPHKNMNPGSYKPHMTIAYVKPNTAIGYRTVIKPLILKPVNYIFSRPNGETIYFTV